MVRRYLLFILVEEPGTVRYSSFIFKMKTTNQLVVKLFSNHYATRYSFCFWFSHGGAESWDLSSKFSPFSYGKTSLQFYTLGRVKWSPPHFYNSQMQVKTSLEKYNLPWTAKGYNLPFQGCLSFRWILGRGHFLSKKNLGHFLFLKKPFSSKAAPLR